MQTATQLTVAAQNKIASQQASQTPTTPAGRMVCSTKEERKSQIGTLVNRVFTRMEAIFPRTWRMSFTTDEMLKLAKRELALSMANWSSLPTQERLDMAIERVKNDGGTWPPSIAEMCLRLKPSMSDFGLPEPEVAFKEACAQAGNVHGHAWSHEAVREAGAATGFWDLRHVSSDIERSRLREIFLAEYEAICNRVIAGGNVSNIALLESDDMKSALERAEAAANEESERKMREFWASRGEEPPKTPDEAISRMRGMLDEGGDA